MQTHILKSDTLYILSGIEDKSYFKNQIFDQGLLESSFFSLNKIKKQVLGVQSLDNKSNEIPYEYNKEQISHILEQILSVRFSQKIPTFYDANDDSEKSKIIVLAQTLNLKHEVIYFKEEKELNGTYFQSNDIVVYTPNLIDTTQLILVGDTHGMLEPLKEFLLNQDFEIKNNSFYHKEKKLVFLGDILDRGPDSLELLKLVMNTVKNKNGYFLLGNHEDKLIQSYEDYLKSNKLKVKGKSLSSSQTFIKFLSLEEKEQKEIYQFLIQAPVNLNLWIDKETLEPTYENKNCVKFGMVHAHQDNYNPLLMPKSTAIYGHSRHEKDSDKLYNENYLKNKNQYILFRGHTKESSKQDHIYSLEDDQAFDGNLMFFDMKKYLTNLKSNNFISTYQLFERATMKKETNYNFDNETKDTVNLLKGLQALHKEGLVTNGVKKNQETGEKISPPDGLKIYKYAKKVHFKRLWKTNLLLEKARGLVLDDAGNIVVHPFDKIYNYEEYDTGKDVKPEQKVYCVEKLNGFLGCISKHHFKNELLFSTTGSLSSDYIDYIREFVDEKTKSNLLEYFKHNNKTLMFEVLHPKDTENHIVPYSNDELGLWLIGARDRVLKAKPDTEENLDVIAKKINMRRPLWELSEFSQVLEKVKNSQLEGYMVRDAETSETLMKIKTNYYLVTKFVGRMSPKRVEMMFSKPETFKEQNMEEEFYPIVDKIVKVTTKDVFLAMEQPERVSFVRSLIVEQRNNVTKKHGI